MSELPIDTNLANAATHTLSNGVRVFAGPRDDPFFINLGRAFDLINIDPVLPGGQAAVQGATADHLSGFNCHSLVVQVPISQLTSDGQAVTMSSDPRAIIGVWSTASRRQVNLKATRGRDAVVGGAWVQVSRLGSPLVNELVIPRSHKNVFNNSEPNADAQFLSFVEQPELAQILVNLFGANGLNPAGLTVPTNPRADLVQVFLTGVPGLNEKGVAAEYLRLNMAIQPSAMPDRLGVLAGQLDGYPNGRRLTDDVVDIALRAVHGVLVDANAHGLELGDTVATNDVPFLTTFPYLAPPHNGVTRQHQ